MSIKGPTGSLIINGSTGPTGLTGPIGEYFINTTSAFMYQYATNVFYPSNISGLTLWFDGADPLNTGTAPSNGTAVGTWYDKSGNGKNATTSNSSIVYNSTSGIYFNGGVGYTLPTGCIPVGTTSPPFSIYIVHNIPPATSNSNNMPLVAFNVAANWSISVCVAPINSSVSGMFFSTYSQNTSGANPADNLPANQRTITSTVISAPTQTFYTNGTALSVSPVSNIPTNYTIGNTNNYLGGINQTNTYITGYISEIVVYSGAHTTEQRQQVEGYLAWKWAAQTYLPVNHPYYPASPSDTPVWNNLMSVRGPTGATGPNSYTPAVSGNWTNPAPTTITNALDRIAVALVSLGKYA
jgi:hypothetical protein